MKKPGKTIALIAGILVILITACVAVLTVIVGNTLMGPSRRTFGADPSLLGLDFKDIQFTGGHNGLVLKGWEIYSPVQSDRWIITSHGYSNCRTIWDMDEKKGIAMFRTLTDRGYNVLAFDYEGCGASEGSMVTVGFYEQDDLRAAVEYLKNSRGQIKIGLMGFSQGAVVSLLAAAGRSDISFVIADSPFSNLQSYLEDNLSVWSGLPGVPFNFTIMTYLHFRAGIVYGKVSPLDSIAGINVPILLIHSNDDPSIPYTNSQALYERWKGKKEISLRLFSGSNHIESYPDHQEEYTELISDFIKNSFR